MSGPSAYRYHPGASGYNDSMTEAGNLLFEVQTPLGFRVRIGRVRWNLIVSIKHPTMAGRESDVKTALEAPDEVRQSRSDGSVP